MTPHHMKGAQSCLLCQELRSILPTLATYVFLPKSGWISQTREAAALVARLSSKQASRLKIWANTAPSFAHKTHRRGHNRKPNLAARRKHQGSSLCCRELQSLARRKHDGISQPQGWLDSSEALCCPSAGKNHPQLRHIPLVNRNQCRQGQ